MLFALIALAVMMIGAAAMVRSMNTSLFNAGNLGFKRDLTNQAERAMNAVRTLVLTGPLANEAQRQATDTARNYSATMLATNAQGLPTALVNDSNFSAAGSSGNDIAVTDQAVTVRYLVDRMCANAGAADTNHCTMSDMSTPAGGQAGGTAIAEESSVGGEGAIPRQTVYRVSIRVSGPRNTQAYFQTTFTL